MACAAKLFGIKPVARGSCFSPEQVDVLYSEWKRFMHNKGVPDSEVYIADQDAPTSERKYKLLRTKKVAGILALPVPDEKWVMQDDSPSEFIAYIRRNAKLLEDLRMSFKPVLNHTGWLESIDIKLVLDRYEYWLRRTKGPLNVLGIMDSEFAAVDDMVKSLRSNWKRDRYHLAVLNTGRHWVCVLIDQVSHTFEYYDSTGRTLDLNNSQDYRAYLVGSLLKATVTLDKSIQARMMQGGNHQKGTDECGMYVIKFIHARLVSETPFETYAKSAVPDSVCSTDRTKFFSVPGTAVNPGVYGEIGTAKIDHKFGEYDIRIAVIEYVAWLEHVRNTVNNAQEISNTIRTLTSMTRSAYPHGDIKNYAANVQREITKFIGSNVTDMWFQSYKSVVTDPLTRKLRALKNSSGHASESRQGLFDRFYKSVFSATNSESEQVKTFVKDLIRDTYVPILNHNKANMRKFYPDMDVRSFGDQCMGHQATVSTAVHMLRTVDRFLVKNKYAHPNTDLNSMEFAPRVVPGAKMNVDPSDLDACTKTMDRARKILIDNLAGMQGQPWNPVATRMPHFTPPIEQNVGQTWTPYGRPGSSTLVPVHTIRHPYGQPFVPGGHVPMRQPFVPGGHVPMRQPFVPRDSESRFMQKPKAVFEGRINRDNVFNPNYTQQPVYARHGGRDGERRKGGSVYDNIVRDSERTIEQGKLFKTNVNGMRITPWDFPIDIGDFNRTQDVTIPKEFNRHSITHVDMEKFLKNERFMLLYVARCSIFAKNSKNDVFTEIERHIVCASVVQMLNASKGTDMFPVLCRLVHVVYDGVIGHTNNKSKTLRKLLVTMAEFIIKCDKDSSYVDEFFEKSKKAFQAINPRSKRGTV